MKIHQNRQLTNQRKSKFKICKIRKTSLSKVAKSKAETIDAYNLGRADAIKEHKREISDGKVDRIIKRNKAIRNFIKVTAYLVLGATMVSWIIFGILGYLNDGSKLAGVYGSLTGLDLLAVFF